MIVVSENALESLLRSLSLSSSNAAKTTNCVENLWSGTSSGFPTFLFDLTGTTIFSAHSHSGQDAAATLSRLPSFLRCRFLIIRTLSRDPLMFVCPSTPLSHEYSIANNLASLACSRPIRSCFLSWLAPSIRAQVCMKLAINFVLRSVRLYVSTMPPTHCCR